MNEPRMAERWKRLLAAILDLSFFIGPVFLVKLVSPLVGASEANEENIGAMCLLVLLVVQMGLLVKRGQTLGKLVLKIWIVDAKTFQNPGFFQIGMVRGVLYLFTITLIVPLIDYLWIFRKGNRCLHDHIAGTIVIRG